MSYKYFRHLFICLLVLLNSACFHFTAHESGQSKNLYNRSKVVTHHRVKAGETLYSIAFEYGRDHRDVARWNRIRRPYTIYPKQKLRIIPINSDGKTTKQYTKDKYQRSTSKKSPPSTGNGKTSPFWYPCFLHYSSQEAVTDGRIHGRVSACIQ